ncbi:MAG: 50S ribosomal protein L11 methyltransferase, partial [Tannerella sp.]|nr:50S ribosomal protein L11 methyltransferase [Tannerella sp.]
QSSEGLVAYIPVACYQTEKLEKCLAKFPMENVTFHYSTNFIKAQNWNEVWEKNYFRPVRIGHECLLRAPFHLEEPGYRFEIMIDPKMAFGTGNHETTGLMLREILTLEPGGKEVLDMGCGTSVLAILAAKKGAGRIVAIDNDEWAYHNAIENCQLNNAPHIQVVLGDASQIARQGMFDYIFANINRNILLRDIPAYCHALKAGGEILLSGFYKEDIPVLEANCIENGLTLLSVAEQNNWVVMRLMLSD